MKTIIFIIEDDPALNHGMAVGDIPYAMGPEHAHGLDINITLPRDEYLRCIPDS